MSSLNDTLISDTFDSLIHANGSPLPVDGLIDLYDGGGNKSSISIGRDGKGAKVSGSFQTEQLSVGDIKYPSTNGTISAFVYQKNPKEWGYIDKIPRSSLEDLDPSPAKTYTNPIKSITVDQRGLVSSVVEIDDVKASKNTISHIAPLAKVTDFPIVLPANRAWVKIDLTNNGAGAGTASVISDTKAITGYLRSTGVINHGGKSTFIQATPNPSWTLVNGAEVSYVYPVIYDIPKDANDTRGMGSMFYTLVSKETTPDGITRSYIYLRNNGGGTDTINATEWILTIFNQHT